MLSAALKLQLFGVHDLGTEADHDTFTFLAQPGHKRLTDIDASIAYLEAVLEGGQVP